MDKFNLREFLENQEEDRKRKGREFMDKLYKDDDQPRWWRKYKKDLDGNPYKQIDGEDVDYIENPNSERKESKYGFIFFKKGGDIYKDKVKHSKLYNKEEFEKLKKEYIKKGINFKVVINK